MITEIPLVPSTNQRFETTLLGVTYRFRLVWSPPAQVWLMDVSDSNDAGLLAGVPLLTGVDLLAQYVYLGIGGQMYVQTDYDAFAMPTFDDLGVLSHLYFVSP